MNLLCYSLFYPVAWAGGAARCASTFMSNFQFSIFNFQLFCASTRFPNCQFSIDEVRAKLIVNCPFSIVNCFTVLLNDEKLTLPGVA